MNEIKNMEIKIINNQPIIEFTIYDIAKHPFKTDFLVDTGFVWSIAFVINKENSSLLKIIEVFNMKELGEENWLEMWNWIKAKTYSWSIVAKFFWETEDIDVSLIEWEKDDMPILWMEFFNSNKKHLSMDFMKKVFRLI